MVCLSVRRDNPRALARQTMTKVFFYTTLSVLSLYITKYFVLHLAASDKGVINHVKEIKKHHKKDLVYFVPVPKSTIIINEISSGTVGSCDVLKRPTDFGE